METKPYRRQEDVKTGALHVMPAYRAILDAARELFAEHGYAGATVRMIADKANVNIAAISYYFRSKDQLYNEVYRDAFTFKNSPFDGLLESVKDGKTWRMAVDTWVERMMYVFAMDDNRNVSMLRRLVMHERNRPTQSCDDMIETFILPALSIMHELVKMAMPGRPAAEVHAYTLTVVGACTIFMSHEKPWDKILFRSDIPREKWIEIMRAQITASIFARLEYKVEEAGEKKEAEEKKEAGRSKKK